MPQEHQPFCCYFPAGGYNQNLLDCALFPHLPLNFFIDLDILLLVVQILKLQIQNLD